MTEEFWVHETPRAAGADSWKDRIRRLKGAEIVIDRGSKVLVETTDPEGLRLCVGDLCDIQPVS